MTEPKPCPFCGSNSIEDEQGDTYRWRLAYCADCGVRGPQVRTDVTGSGANIKALARARSDAFDEWNRREGQARDASVNSVAAPVTPSGAAGEGWISVKDRLPEKFIEVLVAYRDVSLPSTGQYTDNAHDTHDGWCVPSENDFEDTGPVTHWMTLPEPPTRDSLPSGSVSNEAATESTKTTPDAARKSGEAKK